MSDEKKYEVEFLDPTAKGIIDEFKRKYAVIIERIQVYNSLIHKHEDLKNVVEGIEERLSTFPEELQNHGTSVALALSSQLREIKEVEKRLGENEDRHGTFLNRLETVKAEIDYSIAYLSNALNEIKEKSNRKDNLFNGLFDKLEIHEKTNDKLKEEIKQLASKISNHETSNAYLSSLVTHTRQNVAATLDGFNDKFSSLLALEEKFKELEREIDSKILRLSVNVRDETQKLSLSLEGRHKENLDSLESSKSECKKMINDNFIDIKNSQIRFDIINKQLTLIEKKIENINLLLKKYELDK